MILTLLLNPEVTAIQKLLLMVSFQNKLLKQSDFISFCVHMHNNFFMIDLHSVVELHTVANQYFPKQ